VCVIGCGGLGGYVVEMLGRLGIGTITAVDGDVFDETNLNRQILSASDTIGKSKAYTAKERMLNVNPTIKVNPIFGRFTKENAKIILEGHNIVIDALDNISSRLILQESAASLGIPMIHGAIAGWYGQVTTIFPGDNTLASIYTSSDNSGIESTLGNPSFTPALVASLQVCEALKALLQKDNLLRKKILIVNLLNHEYEIVEL
jgi:molybdopterin/thiamine biosynthesis adenylyltransferase